MVTRRSRPKSFCLRPDQDAYITTRVGNLGDFSRWVRGAIDLRIFYERKAKPSKITELMSGADFDPETANDIRRIVRDNDNIGVFADEKATKAPNDARAPVVEKPTE